MFPAITFTETRYCGHCAKPLKVIRPGSEPNEPTFCSDDCRNAKAHELKRLEAVLNGAVELRNPFL